MSAEEEIIQKIREENTPTRNITETDRDKAILRILHHPDTEDQLRNAWDCITKFYETTKAMGSQMQEHAKQAAVFINKLRATYELYGPDTNSGEQPVDQSALGR